MGCSRLAELVFDVRFEVADRERAHLGLQQTVKIAVNASTDSNPRMLLLVRPGIAFTASAACGRGLT